MNVRTRRTLLLACAVLTGLAAPPAWSGGLAIVETVVSDNGDGDGFADTRETVTLRLRVQNTTAGPLTDVVAHLTGTDPALACIVEASLAVGDLAPGETRLTDTGFVFVVADLDRAGLGLGPFDELSLGFELEVSAQPASPKAYPSRLRLDLDLEVSGGAGPTSFAESFESATLGAFEIENLDSVGPWGDNLIYFEGARCQYSDPDWPNSNSYGSPDAATCFPGETPLQADAVFWGLSGPGFSPLGGRGFSGFHSLFFGIDMGPPKNWTTPLAILEAVRTAQPIALGWAGSAPTLSLKHQMSLPDWRSIGIPVGRSSDRGVVLAQVADATGQPAGNWIKLDPYQNPYDTQAYDFFFNCMFDPTDDGDIEDDFYDPSDPERRLGPSSTCYPEFAFSNIGETSLPAAPGNVGGADGPGLQGLWGVGTWIESSFDLSRFRGRSVRLRFLVAGLKAQGNETWEEYFGFNPDPRDDGWWIDDILVTGALTTPAVVATDLEDNSLLPEAPPGLDPDLDAVCADDNCPDLANPDQTDGDADGAGLACDCADDDAATYPGAPETNDARDNQCPGEAGYGLIDEVSGTSGFTSTNKNEFSWPAQPGAIRYQVARANHPSFVIGCMTFPLTPQTSIVDAQAVPPGAVRYYLVRSYFPNKGSWGQNSAGQPRLVFCAP